MRSDSFHRLLVESAQAEGFPLAGALDLDPILEDASSPFHAHVAHYDRWVQAGYAGLMGYLVRGRDRRANPKLVFPEAKSVLMVARPYPRRPAGATQPQDGARYARYLQGRDYHLEMSESLERMMKRVSDDCVSRNEAPLKWKVCVDTSAVLERTWAALAGLGWIGKNTLLIHPQHGSYLFLGAVLIDRETGGAPRPLKDYCGNCTRCQEACPTKAFKEPHLLDSNRCISYLTLERRGELKDVPQEVRQATGTWVAGCDLCQEVCPFNLKATKKELLEAGPTPPPIEGDITTIRAWRELLEETADSYRSRVTESSLNRIKPHQFSRNLALALAHALRDADTEQFARMREELGGLIERRARDEMDPAARPEWELCLEELQR